MCNLRSQYQCISLVGWRSGSRQVAVQRAVLRDALRRWESREEPATIWERDYPDYVANPTITNNGEILL